MKEAAKALSFLSQDLISEILSVSQIRDFPKETEILREGQYVKVKLLNFSLYAFCALELFML